MLDIVAKEWIEVGALVVAIIVALTGLRTAKTAEKSAEAQLDAVHAMAIAQAIDDYQRLGRTWQRLWTGIARRKKKEQIFSRSMQVIVKVSIMFQVRGEM